MFELSKQFRFDAAHTLERRIDGFTGTRIAPKSLFEESPTQLVV